MDRSHRAGYSQDRLATLGSTVCIYARHFASPSSENTRPSREYRQRLLEEAEELTGIPLESLPLADGSVAQAWRPARGEVGWLPYEESPILWGMRDVRGMLVRLAKDQRHAVLTAMLEDKRWAHPTRSGDTVYEVATGEAHTVGAWWPYNPLTEADGEHVIVTLPDGGKSDILPMSAHYTWEKPAEFHCGACGKSRPHGLPCDEHPMMPVRPGPAPRADSFPSPFVVRPTPLQLVRGARAEYEGKPGEVLTGWLKGWELEPGDGVACRVTISVNRPGSMLEAMLAPHVVPVEKVARSGCQPDPAPEACWHCGQSGEPKGGEYPCAVCFRPTTHDEEMLKSLNTDNGDKLS